MNITEALFQPFEHDERKGG